MSERVHWYEPGNVTTYLPGVYLYEGLWYLWPVGIAYETAEENELRLAVFRTLHGGYKRVRWAKRKAEKVFGPGGIWK